MTMLNGQPIDDPMPPPGSSVEPVTPPLDAASQVLGVITLITAFVFPLAAIVIGGIALAQARSAGTRNVLAAVGFVLGIVFTVLIVVIVVVFIVLGVSLFSEVFRVCQELGPGVHEYHGVRYECNT
jgi:hypothetical protein